MKSRWVPYPAQGQRQTGALDDLLDVGLEEVLVHVAEHVLEPEDTQLIANHADVLMKDFARQLHPNAFK